MSFISHRHRLIFLHVAKTGGRSMNVLLRKHCRPEIVFNTSQLDRHVNCLGRLLAVEAMGLTTTEIWGSYFKFAFVRNPWDRTVSMYEHLKQSYSSYRKGTDPELTDKVILMEAILTALGTDLDGFTFPVFVKSILRDRAIDNYHWDSQVNALSDKCGNILVDFVGRFENLNHDFDRACDQAALPPMTLPHIHRTSHLHYSTYYSSDLIDIVGTVYASDVAAFKYDFRTDAN